MIFERSKAMQLNHRLREMLSQSQSGSCTSLSRILESDKSAMTSETFVGDARSNTVDFANK